MSQVPPRELRDFLIAGARDCPSENAAGKRKRTKPKRIDDDPDEESRPTSGRRQAVRMPPLRPQTTHRVTVWYQEDGGVNAWRGECLRVRERDGHLRVRFDAMPSGHVCKEMWVDPDVDEWAVGDHQQRLGAQERTASTGRLKPSRRSSSLGFAWGGGSTMPDTVAASRGSRSWPLAFRRCLEELDLLQGRLQDAGWLRGTPVALEDALLDRKGFTGLVDAAVHLLSHVPCANWVTAAEWPCRGDWSSPLLGLHSPVALQAKLVDAVEHVVRWPDPVRAVPAAASSPSAASSSTASTSASVSSAVSPAATATGCFVCGHSHEVLQAHPQLEQLRLCGLCHDQLVASEWPCDVELLALRCSACGHVGAAVHGCRTCGGSLCERCVWMLEGETALQAARARRFECTRCPACGEAEAPFGDAVRICCDTCRLEWHPSCHVPPVLDIPGWSRRWTCAHCSLLGPPKSPAWSLPCCAMCASERQHTAGFHLSLDEEDFARFDHPRAIARMNRNIDEVNQALRRSAWVLDAASLRRLAERATGSGGVCVVSICDGKGTALGVLLSEGVHVRRYLSVERDEEARRVLRANYGGGRPGLAHDALRFFDDAAKVKIGDLKSAGCWPVDLLLGSVPCNDLSGCNSEAAGVHSEHLIHPFCRLRRALARDNSGTAPAMLFENVVPSSLEARRDVLAALRLPALRSEGAVFEAARRPRWLISNMSFVSVPTDTRNVLLQEVLNPGARALADKAGCIIGGTIGAGKESVATAGAHSKRNRGRELVLSSAHGTEATRTQLGR